jgi:hypothetical protein
MWPQIHMHICRLVWRKFRTTENGTVQVSMKISKSRYGTGPLRSLRWQKLSSSESQRFIAVSQGSQRDDKLNAFNSVQSLQSDPKSLIPVTLIHFRMARNFVCLFLLTSPTGCGRSVRIVRLRTKSMEFFFLIIERRHDRWVPCHHGMARPQVADGEDALQFWRVAANILNKQLRTANKGWTPSLAVGRGANNTSP